jgi:ribonuclease BN (tRNA processing enzyme)
MVEHLRASTVSLSDLPFALTVTEVRGPFDLCGARVTPFEVKHSRRLTALAYRIEYRGRVLATSGDSEPCDALVEACRDADAAILDATAPDPMPAHMSGAQAAEVARRAGVKRPVFSHLGPAWAGRLPDGAAADLMKLDLT